MPRFILIVVLAVMLYSPAQAARQGQNYFGIQYALTEVDPKDSGLDEFEPTALGLKVGHFTTNNVAIEGRLGIGLQDDDQSVGPFDIEFEIDRLIGLYAVFQTSGSGTTDFYGIVGFSEVEGSISIDGFSGSESEDESGLSYGFGVNIGGFNAEYMVYLDEDDVEVTAIGLGYVGYF